MRDLRKARKTLQRLAILPEVEEILPKSYTSTERAKALIATSDWLGADHCCDCGLQSDYCSCDFVRFGKYLPKPSLVTNTLFRRQSGEEESIQISAIKISDDPNFKIDGRVSTVRVDSLETAILKRLREKRAEKLADPTFYSKFRPQSGPVPAEMNIRDVPVVNGTNIIDFADQPGGYMYDAGGTMDDTRGEQDDPETYLGDFFKRPVWIYTGSWGTGTNFGASLNPWALYFEQPRVLERLNNFNMMRAKLHLKIVINGNGFQYGRLLANYLPLADWDDFSSNAFLIPEDAVQASQQQHLYLNPTTSTGGEMVLPFFHYQNNVSVPFRQWSELGMLYIRSLNQLKHANGASDSCTINIFAWAEDMTATGLTHLLPQSGEEVDQANVDGVISGPATAVANASNALSVIPMLQPYAKATSRAAMGIANAAKMFGLSRPNVTKEPEPMVPRAIGNLATCTVPDSSHKLSIDDKQELSIDPRIAGLSDVDPLSIKEIATRESYLTKFTWARTQPPGELMWNARVTPYSFASSAGGALHFPACCAVALPFSYWTGTMRYRFQIVCSAFHKGRLQITYDAMHPEPSYQEVVSCYNRIVDISQETDVTIEVAPCQTTPFLQAMRPGETVQSEIFSTTPYIYDGSFSHNGVISICVLNTLTTPNSTVDNDIEINVFISAGDDFEVAAPNDMITKYEFKPQSGLEAVDGLTIHADAPQTADTKCINQPIKTHPMRDLVFMGERITSLRTLLKRYSHFRTIGHWGDSANTINTFSCRNLMFPYWRGRVSGAVDVTDAATPYNYVNTTILHWVTIGFQAFRGSLRYKIIPRTFSPNVTLTANRVTPHVGDLAFYEASVEQNRPLGFTAVRWLGVYSEGALGVPNSTGPALHVFGSTAANGSVNPTLEYEVPYYSTLRFSPIKRANLTTTNTVMEDMVDVRISVQGQPGNNSLFDQLVAVGEDFQLYQWVGMPRVYYRPNPPTFSPA